jgi:hypothetical protein
MRRLKLPDEIARPLRRHPAAGIALLALLVFLPSLWTGLVWDDVPLIADNPQIRSFDNLSAIFTSHYWNVGEQLDPSDPWGLSQSHERRYYRPLLTTSFMVDWAIGRGGAWSHHLGNVLLHAMATALATLIALRWTGRFAAGLVAGLVFALHPTRSESVVWVAGRSDVLMTVCMLASVELSFRASRASGRGAMVRAVAAVLFALMALLSKEPAVFLPLLLLVDPLVSDDSRAALRRAAPQLAAVTLSCVGYGVARLLWLPVGTPGDGAFSPARALSSIGWYGERCVWPWRQSFFVHMLEYDADGVVLPLFATIAGAVLLLALVVWFLWALRRDHASALLLSTCAAFIGPLLGLFASRATLPTQDRFLYLPLWLLTVALLRLAARRRWSAPGIASGSTSCRCVQTTRWHFKPTVRSSQSAATSSRPTGCTVDCCSPRPSASRGRRQTPTGCAPTCAPWRCWRRAPPMAPSRSSMPC